MAAVPGVSLAVLQRAVVETEAALSKLAARRAVLLAAVESRGAGLVPDGEGGSMPLVPWLRDATGMPLGSARRAVEVARGLAALPAVRDACVAGDAADGPGRGAGAAAGAARPRFRAGVRGGAAAGGGPVV